MQFALPKLIALPNHSSVMAQLITEARQIVSARPHSKKKKSVIALLEAAICYAT
jgi:hypothetical protein